MFDNRGEPDDALFVSFLTKMLQTDPDQRSSICELLDDPWITNNGEIVMDLFLVTKTISDIKSEIILNCEPDNEKQKESGTLHIP